jgi:hypothetical protein
MVLPRQRVRRSPGSACAGRLAWGVGLWDERQRQSPVPARPAQGTLSETRPHAERVCVSWTWLVHTRARCRALYTMMVLWRRPLEPCQ